MRSCLGRRLVAAVAVFVVMGASLVYANTVVAPNANTSVSGNTFQLGVLAGGDVTFQVAFDSSQFSGVAVGSKLNGIGLRVAAGNPTINEPISYSNYSIEVATAAVAVSSLTATFAANESADDTIVRSGALTIPANALVGGAGPNPFYELAFSTPFTYAGGSLVVTLRHSNPGDSFDVDANSLFLTPVTNTVANFGDANATSDSGQGPGFFNAPVVSFDFSSVPEPATLSVAGVGLMVMTCARRRRSRV